ncbi:Glycerol-3-phosphate acyltransferase [invertebrate metagenome]|uniref:Glycerol-3-phosphate acyltransferase n=1 Tax=invertebrate metagenome TaxID=1711999 RepID=A0A2H9TCG0_9ZZZZ
MQHSSFIHRAVSQVLRKLLMLWVKTSTNDVTPETLGMDHNKTICYVLNYRSLSDLLVLDHECIVHHLPLPMESMVTDKGERIHSFFWLSQQEGVFLQRFRPKMPDTIKQMIDWLDHNPSQNIQLVPVSIFWGRAPEKEQSALKLLFDWNFSVGGRFRKLLATLIHGRNTMVNFGPAIALRDVVDERDEQGRNYRRVGRILRVHFRQLRNSVIGPDLSHRRTMVNGLIKTSSIRQAIDNAAASDGISKEAATLKARKYADEIASDYTFSAIRFLDIVLTWFWHKLYNGINVKHADPLKSLAQTHTLVYVPCHRSHIDYLLLSYVLYKEGLTPPYIAAGINLNMPVVGTILRKSGAFFIRRSFRGNALYSSVFHEYMFTLLSRGFSTEYFVEGGRSRTGRTLKPKKGMLSITLRSFFRDNRKPVAFIPVYIGYEKVLEVGTYLGELRGKAKKKESVLDIIKTVAALKNQFGKAWVNFGEPVHLADFLDHQEPVWRSVEKTEDFKPSWLKPVTSQLSSLIAQRINGAAVVNPVNMVAMALLSMPRYALGKQELIQVLDTYKYLLLSMPYSFVSVVTDQSAEEMLAYVEDLELVSRYNDSLGNIFILEGNVAIQMTYYRNNVLHIFAIPSLISCLFVNNASITRREVLRICSILYPYLRSELFLAWDQQTFLKVVRNWLHVMNKASLIRSNGKGIYRQPETDSTEFVMLTILSRAISQTIERFYMTISLLIGNGSGVIEQAELEKQARELAQRMSSIYGLNAPEFFDKSLFSGFIEQLRKRDVVQVTSVGKLMFGGEVRQATQEAYKLLARDIRHSIHQTAQKQKKG